MSFHVGQKVVCVDDLSLGLYLTPGIEYIPGLDGLKKGRFYTISYVGCEENRMVCRLAEIQRPFDAYLGKEGVYAQARFRPIVERKTDISVFTEMLERWEVPA